MNALFIHRMSDYLHSPQAGLSAAVLVAHKVERSNIFLTHFHKPPYRHTVMPIVYTNNVSLLLYEGRVAQYYWRQYIARLPAWVHFPSRRAQAVDITNRLLDIGYHHLAIIVRKVLEEKDCSTALALLHTAQTSDSTPLVYDLMELFRADIVDTTVVTWLRQKKRPITKLTQKHIAHVLSNMNERLLQHYYLHDFKQYHTYRYYLELQITKFIKAVNHGEVFEPLKLPSRHDTRCNCNSTTTMV